MDPKLYSSFARSDCPSCVSHITSILSPFVSTLRPSILDLAVSYLTHQVTFRLDQSALSSPSVAPSADVSVKEGFIRDCEGLLRAEGFEVERIAPAKPPVIENSRPFKEHKVKAVGWLESLGYVSTAEKDRRERRRKHVEFCAECQKELHDHNQDQTQAEVAVVGKGKGREQPVLAVKVDQIASPKLVETEFSIEGMFCASVSLLISLSLWLSASLLPPL